MFCADEKINYIKSKEKAEGCMSEFYHQLNPIVNWRKLMDSVPNRLHSRSFTSILHNKVYIYGSIEFVDFLKKKNRMGLQHVIKLLIFIF